MKKSLLALAVLGAFAGAASAQSSVTIYGQIDQGITKGNGGTAPNTGANGTSEAWQLKQAHGSRLGFRGNEDLGGGLSAQFLFEHRFQPDTGAGSSSATAASVFWDGGSYVQLTSAAAGSVYFGRWYTPAFWINLKTDPFGYDGVAQVGSKGFAGFLTPGPNGPGVRSSNTVGYKTPNLGGFTANAAVGLGEAVHGRDAGVNAEYTAGPIYAGVGYEKVSGGPAGAAGNTVDGNSLFNVGFAYNFGVIRPMVYFARSKTGVGSVNTNKLAQVALTAPIGPGVLKAMVLRYTPQDDKTETKFGIGYDYFLSKRTRVYADYGSAKKDGVVTVPGTSYTNNNAFNLGVRHDF
ncbi:MAG: porin [Cytophagales bacterium]|nr:porin [Rhizobacter sp.]